MTTQSQIDRLNKEIASLRRSDAREVENEAKATSKLNRAQEGARRASSPSALSAKVREMERAQRDLAKAGSKRADFATKIANRASSLGSYQQRLDREQKANRRKEEDRQRRMLRDREQAERQMSQQRSMLQFRANLLRVPKQVTPNDFFICHASEDKDAIVRDLAVALRAMGKEVWFDEFTLRVGDSLRSRIDEGLASSKFGVVIVSKHLFVKDWPQRELNGLFGLEAESRSRILPIWHEISKDEIVKHSPMLADKVALHTSLMTAKQLADELCTVLDE